jgi:hypothetical protein
MTKNEIKKFVEGIVESCVNLLGKDGGIIWFQ